ncbi:MAG: histidinol-phosphate transaminase [Armatimonadetes bacterium]|nr:histidinol-phosphate transaminase [Armatimonadota bacterium]
MQPYSPGKPIDEVKRELGLTDVVKLASNENPLGPSPKAVEAVKRAAEEMHLYPDAGAYQLKERLSQHLDLPPEQIMVGNGSDELIHMLGSIFLSGPEDNIVVGDPSFVRYDAAAQLSDSQLIKVPVTSNLKLDLSAMAKAATEHTKLVWIANPNNPTGTLVSKLEVDELLTKLPAQTVVVLDEAYFEFASDQAKYPNSLDYVRAGKPVIGLRTFSKAYGLAGIRIGYGFASIEIVDAINRAREPFNANLLAQAAAIAALDDQEFLNRTVQLNAEGRAQLNEAFRAVGSKPVESFANFVLADLGIPAKPVFEALLREGVIVRSGHVLGLPNYLRVSIGTKIENERFGIALSRVMAAQGKS